MSDVPVILDWDDERAWATIREGDHAVHVLTNSRAYSADHAERLVAAAAGAARRRLPGCRLVLRGDSTLRAHLWEEYLALRSVVAPGREDVPLLLVPALPSAGRVTIGGVHLIERDGQRIPLSQTEYARDGELAYSTATLSLWAQERSGGRLHAADAVNVTLERLRYANGAREVAAALVGAAGLGRAAVVAADAETEDDLRVIADGLELAEAAGAVVVVRSAPAFVATLTGARAECMVPAPRGVGQVLVICGSFVPMTTEQLARLEADWPATAVAARATELAGAEWGAEVRRVADNARRLIERHGLAVVATDRTRLSALAQAPSQQRIASALAQVARRVPADVVIAKGGITSAVTAREGLGARAARVLGPLCPGVSLWRLADGDDYVVVPGNVGGPELLTELVASIRTGTGSRC